jgi:hypothetical protein
MITKQIIDKTYQDNQAYENEKRTYSHYDNLEFVNCVFKHTLDRENTCDSFKNCKFKKPNEILPEKGSFIAWKKVLGKNSECVLKLLVLETAKRVTPYVVNNRKCRVSKVMVLAAYSAKTGKKIKATKFRSKHDYDFIYQVGSIASVSDFDSSRARICTKGIHVFITKQEAMDY